MGTLVLVFGLILFAIVLMFVVCTVMLVNAYIDEKEMKKADNQLKKGVVK